MVHKLSVILIFYSMTVWLVYLALASLLHTEFDHRNIKKYYYGHLIGTYGMFAMISAFLNQYFIKWVGRSRLLFLGIFFMSTWICLLGFITYIEDNMIMIGTGIVLRAGQGFFRMWTAVPCWSIIAILQPEDNEMYLGLMEGAMSIGIGLGPILGSVLYELVGFVYLFVIIGAFHFAYIPVMMLVKPPDIDSDDQSAQILQR